MVSFTPALLLVSLSFSTGACSSGTNHQGAQMTVQTFEECTAKLLSPSLELIKKMRSDGVDLTKARSVTHLLVGDDTKIKVAKEFFAQKGFDLLEAGNSRLLLGDDVPLSESWAQDIVPKICSKAAEFGLIYDGWDVDMTQKGGKQK